MIGILFSYVVIVLLLIAISAYFYKKDKKAIFPLWDSVVFGWILAFILKLLIKKPRLLESFYPFGIINYSFPSSHTTLVFAALPVLFVKTKKIRWYWLIYALFVGYSRIYLGKHYISDVIAGIIVGILSGIFIIYIYKKFGNKFRKKIKIFKDYF